MKKNNPIIYVTEPTQKPAAIPIIFNSQLTKK